MWANKENEIVWVTFSGHPLIRRINRKFSTQYLSGTLFNLYFLNSNLFIVWSHNSRNILLANIYIYIRLCCSSRTTARRLIKFYTPSADVSRVFRVMFSWKYCSLSTVVNSITIVRKPLYVHEKFRDVFVRVFFERANKRQKYALARVNDFLCICICVYNRRVIRTLSLLLLSLFFSPLTARYCNKLPQSEISFRFKYKRVKRAISEETLKEDRINFFSEKCSAWIFIKHVRVLGITCYLCVMCVCVNIKTCKFYVFRFKFMRIQRNYM